MGSQSPTAMKKPRELTACAFQLTSLDKNSNRHFDDDDVLVVSYWTVYKKFASQSQHKYKIIIFFSGEAKDSVIFSFFILLHKRAKPIHPPYIHPSAHLSTHSSAHPYTHSLNPTLNPSVCPAMTVECMDVEPIPKKTKNFIQ
jgi:hypothetical protein